MFLYFFHVRIYPRSAIEMDAMLWELNYASISTTMLLLLLGTTICLPVAGGSLRQIAQIQKVNLEIL